MAVITAQVKAVTRRFLPSRLHNTARLIVSSSARSRFSLARALKAKYGNQIQSGLFEGMKYVDRAMGSELLPKLVGTYEKELAPLFLEAKGPFDSLIDIGAAEGYYAVGLLRNGFSRQCIAFEAVQQAHKLLRGMAELNEVWNQISLHGSCTTESLDTAISASSKPFVLSDCEGAELELLDPAAVPSLAKATILIEVHGRLEVPPQPGEEHPAAMARFLAQRFSPTHRVTTIPQRLRTLEDWPRKLAKLGTSFQRLAAMDEHRTPGPGWLLLEPSQLN